jgi:DNA polymerase II large subunit
MLVLGRFIAVGTQLRLEKPGKAGIAATVDSIEPPIVRLKDGSVVRLSDPKRAEALLDSIDKILFLGDILVGFGEFLENNRPLLPSGFVEEWWSQLMEVEASKYPDLRAFADHLGVSETKLASFLALTARDPTAEEAVLMAKRSPVPLHPKYSWFWENIAPQDFDQLRSVLLDRSRSAASGRRMDYRRRLGPHALAGKTVSEQAIT